MDDVWALVFMLRCPELDVRLITTCTGDTTHRAALVAKILELMDCTHIPIGIGIPLDDNPHTHEHWLGDYDLSQYQGTLIQDGVGAICAKPVVQHAAKMASNEHTMLGLLMH